MCIQGASDTLDGERIGSTPDERYSFLPVTVASDAQTLL